MKTIGIRELRANLSRVLRAVAAGDPFLISNRGRIVAELRSPPIRQATANSEQRGLARLIALGNVRLATATARAYARSPLASPNGLASALLDTDRGE